MERRLESRKVRLNIPDAVATWLCDHGFDPMFGARPLQRLVGHTIMNPLARMLLDGSVRDGELVRAVMEKDAVVLLSNHAPVIGRPDYTPEVKA